MTKEIKLNNYIITRESVEIRKIKATTNILAGDEQEALDLILERNKSMQNSYDFRDELATRLSITDTYEVNQAI